MHFSMAMEPPAFWLVRAAMLVGKCGGANYAPVSAAMPQGSIGQIRSCRPEDFLKFS